MVGSNTITNTWTRRFMSNKRQWPNPQDSTGQLYRKMGRDSSCWEAIGSARETFIRIANDIKTHLEKYSDPVPHPVTWTMYMIGQTRETSEPTIMFCSRNTNCRKRVRKTVKDSDILKAYPGVKLGDASRPPDFDQLVQLAGVSLESAMPGVSVESLKLGFFGLRAEIDGDSLYTNELAYAKPYGIFLAKQSPFLSLTKIAILLLYFYLTAGHAFETPAESPVPKLVEDDDDDFDFDIGDSSESEEEVDFFVEATSRGSITPEFTNSSSSDVTTKSVSASTNFTAHLEDGVSAQENVEEDWKDIVKFVDGNSNSDGTELLLPVGSVAMGRLLSTLNDQSRPSLDYALIEIDRYFRDFDQQPLKEEIDSPYLNPQGIVKSPQDANVLCVTGSAGLLKGTVSGTPTYRAMPGFNEIQELWTVRLEGYLTNGDCGSWVVEAQSGNLLGHVVAGSPESGVAFIVPAYHVFEDSKTRFGLELEFCLTTESKMKQKVPQAKITSSANSGPRHGENQTTTSLVHQKSGSGDGNVSSGPVTATMKGKQRELDVIVQLPISTYVQTGIQVSDDNVVSSDNLPVFREADEYFSPTSGYSVASIPHPRRETSPSSSPTQIVSRLIPRDVISSRFDPNKAFLERPRRSRMIFQNELRASSVIARPLSEPQRDPSQSNSVRALMKIILKDINLATKWRDKPDKSFVCYEDLERIWSNQSRISTLLRLDLSESQIDVIQTHMLRILFTLIAVGATNCLANFRARLFDPSSGDPLVTDDGIPFEINELTFLDSEPALQQLFYDYQFRFKPVKILLSRGQRTQVIDHRMRLPFEYREKNIGSGGYGKVDLVGISPRYIKNETGSSWETVYKVACKKIKTPKDFDQEVDNLQILKESLTRYRGIMLHLTTIVHGPNRYILLPYAQYGDLELFFHCGVGPDRKKKYDFDKYFPEVRNGNVTHHLLHQCWLLANALEWLHNGIIIEKTSSTVICAHMDLKPANILIQPDPDSAVGKWMISDFGISVLKEKTKVQDSEFVSIGDYISQLTMNTRPKRLEGTYQAPEVKLTETAWNQSSYLTPDQKGIGRKSDIWSYGCIFSEVLAFAQGGNRFVIDFQSRRKGHEGKDYFYIEKVNQGYLSAPGTMQKQYQVHPSVSKWLNGLCGLHGWVDCTAKTIQKILIVDTAERPNATELTKLVNHVKEHFDNAKVNCSVLRAKNEADIQRTPDPPTPASGSLREDLNAMSRGNQTPPFDSIDFVVREVPYGDGDKDPRIRHCDDVSLINALSVRSKESSGTHSSVSTMSIKPAYAHGIMIDPDVPRTPNEPITVSLRAEGSNSKATSVALTYSGNKVYAAYLFNSSIYFHKLDVEEMSATLEDPLELPLPHPRGWEDIAIGGFFLAAWGFSSNKMQLYLCDIRDPQRQINLPSSYNIEMLCRAAVSERGVAALLCREKILVVRFDAPTPCPLLHAPDGQKFTDVTFNDTGELLFAWAYGQRDSLCVWRCQDCVVNERTEFESIYKTDKRGKPFLTRVVPYNTYPGCIIKTPHKRFFPARVRRPSSQTSEPQPRDHEVEISKAKAVCVFRDHSMIVAEEKLLKEYKIEYEGNHLLGNSGVKICKLKTRPRESSRLLVIKQSENIISIICNIDGTVEFVKIVPA